MLRCMRLAALSIVTATASLTIPPHNSAQAQIAVAPCGASDDVRLILQQRFGQEPVSWAISARGQVFEVLLAENGAWSMVVTSPNGASCIIATGKDWQKIPVPETGPAA